MDAKECPNTGGERDRRAGLLGELEGYGLLSPERANEICAAWGVSPVAAGEEGVSDAALAQHLCQELGLDCRSGLRGRGNRCGDLVARLMDYLDQQEGN